MIRVATLSLCLAASAWAQGKTTEELTPYSVKEIEQYLDSFKSSYRKRDVPEEDAVAILTNFEKAYRYLESKGEDITKEEEDAKEDIVKMISRGLRARRRPTVTAECARTLGRLADPEAGRAVMRWMSRVLDEKEANPLWVEYGFIALARIGGKKDRRIQDMILKEALRGKDTTIQSQAYRAAYLYRELDGRVRKEWFEKMVRRVNGLYTQSVSGDPKQRGVYEKRYNEIKQHALKALNELSPPETNWDSPGQAYDWFQENKRGRWSDYAGIDFRKKDKEKKKDAPGS